jgi:predicted nucleotidyltransferase
MGRWRLRGKSVNSLRNIASNMPSSADWPGYEDELFRRAIDVELEPGKVIHVCSAEDLIIHKAIAGRPQDLADIDGVVLRQGKRLNTTCIRQWLKEFSDILAGSEILERFERAYRKRPSK